jgi:peptidoglycan/LPS O-acetylase OafA/YrhL
MTKVRRRDAQGAFLMLLAALPLLIAFLAHWAYEEDFVEDQKLLAAIAAWVAVGLLIWSGLFAGLQNMSWQARAVTGTSGLIFGLIFGSIVADALTQPHNEFTDVVVAAATSIAVVTWLVSLVFERDVRRLVRGGVAIGMAFVGLLSGIALA